MFRNWFIISILILMGLTVALQSVPIGPPAGNPIALGGGDGTGDGGDEDDDPGGPGL